MGKFALITLFTVTTSFAAGLGDLASNLSNPTRADETAAIETATAASQALANGDDSVASTVFGSCFVAKSAFAEEEAYLNYEDLSRGNYDTCSDIPTNASCTITKNTSGQYQALLNQYENGSYQSSKRRGLWWTTCGLKFDYNGTTCSNYVQRDSNLTTCEAAAVNSACLDGLQTLCGVTCSQR